MFPPSVAFARGAVRVDSGVRQGDVISPWYDPMIAKVITHGDSRVAALNLLADTLARVQVAGTTNLELLAALARHPGFAVGAVDTDLIGRDVQMLTSRAPVPDPVTALAALAALGLMQARSATDPWEHFAAWRGWSQAEDFVTLDAGGTQISLRILHLGKGRFRASWSDHDVELSTWRNSDGSAMLEVDGLRTRVELAIAAKRVSVFHGGQSYSFGLIDLLIADAEQASGDTVLAPMPGLVTAITTEAGARVQKGDPLLILEAMKMEHVLTAPRDGKVAEVLVRARDQVSDGTLLLRLEAVDG